MSHDPAKLRKLCRCGHVRNSHTDQKGKCGTGSCGCEEWLPAYPVYDDTLPEGVLALRFYTSTGLTLVECSHALGRNPDCPFCRGDSRTTKRYKLPVKRLVFAPEQAALFA